MIPFTDRRPRVYGASRMDRAAEWRRLQNTCPEIAWTARWPDVESEFAKRALELTEWNCRTFWLHDVADIQRSDYVLVLPPRLIEDNRVNQDESHYDGVLRGAIFEAGVAIGLGKPVVLVGECPDYGTWQHHPLVMKFPYLQASLAFIIGDFK